MFENILVLSPHTDDGELGAGGMLDKFHKKGCHIHFIAFSWCENKKLIDEAKSSLEILGIDQIDVLDFPRRYFFQKRQEILDILYKINNTEDIDLVLIPSPRDLHQDHEVICREGIRAFKTSSILGYELPWNNIIFQTSCFVELTEENVKQKLKALKCYSSQQYRNYFKDDFQWSFARTRGTQIDTNYAEAFEMIKLVIKD